MPSWVHIYTRSKVLDTTGVYNAWTPQIVMHEGLRTAAGFVPLDSLSYDTASVCRLSVAPLSHCVPDRGVMPGTGSRSHSRNPSPPSCNGPQIERMDGEVDLVAVGVRTARRGGRKKEGSGGCVLR